MTTRVRPLTLTEIQEAQPLAQALLYHLQARKARVVTSFLSGQPVNPVEQGRAAEVEVLIRLLQASPHDIIKELAKEV